jgi:hypothetical protein
MICCYLMRDKKKSTRQFVDDMKALRKRESDPDLIEKFNKVMEEDGKHEQEESSEPVKKKVAKDFEVEI